MAVCLRLSIPARIFFFFFRGTILLCAYFFKEMLNIFRHEFEKFNFVMKFIFD